MAMKFSFLHFFFTPTATKDILARTRASNDLVYLDPSRSSSFIRVDDTAIILVVVIVVVIIVAVVVIIVGEIRE